MQELTTHMRLATGANKDAINLDYLIHVRNAIMRPLINNGTEGIEAALNVMRSYYLMRFVYVWLCIHYIYIKRYA